MDPVLVLGAGINGAALARELVLHGIPVCLVDACDIASGTTPYSSRLIHGGLRYLEYGEFDLVQESVEERTRLLHLAPHLVRPLPMFLPVTSRLGGLGQAVRRFFHLERRSANNAAARGLWLVRAGLWLYDRYARSSRLPHHAVHRLNDPGLPPVDRSRYIGICSYHDAQVRYPERFVVSLIEDARRVALQHGVSFQLATYARADYSSGRVSLHWDGRPSHWSWPDGVSPSPPSRPFAVSAVVNATGPWVDQTLHQLHVPAPPLIGGTRGSHLLTHNTELRRAMDHGAVYAEAVDGRMIFVLPFGDAVLIGTTDIPYDGDPRDAVTTEEEIDYLIESVHAIFPQVALSRGDIELHYCGVRPLPRSDAARPSAITRRHVVQEHTGSDVPTFSLIGGKLTTCRSLAEEAAARIARCLALPARHVTRDRPFPGGERYPRDHEALDEAIGAIAARWKIDRGAVREMWAWYGTDLETVLQSVRLDPGASVSGTAIPEAVVRSIIANEWVTRLEDLIERRLMLLFAPSVSLATVRHVARLMVMEGRLEASDVDRAVARVSERLAGRFGKRLVEDGRG